MTLTSPQRLPLFEGQGLPQRLGTPYSLSLSLSLSLKVDSPSSVSHQGTRVSAASAPVEPRDDMMTGLSVIEGIDLSAEVPCEAGGHEHDAELVASGRCPGCKSTWLRAVCWAAWNGAIAQYPSVKCPRCGLTNIPSREAWVVVEVLR